MAGNVFDISRHGFPRSIPIVADSNVVIARLLASDPFYESQNRRNAKHAAVFFDALQESGQQILLTPTGYSEVIHAAIKSIYQRARSTRRAELAERYGRGGSFTWLDLYKIAPAVLQEQSDLFDEWRQRLVATNIVLLDPTDLGPIPSGQRYDRELLDLVVRYGLDTSDATILMEATRVGVHSIVSLDRDMQRAVADFDVYTWLS